MNSKTERAILLALEALVASRPSPKAKKALEAINKALESGGYRMPENEGGW